MKGNLKNLKINWRNAALSLLGLMIFTGVYYYIGVRDTLGKLAVLPLSVIIISCLITIVNILIKTFRWQLILRNFSINIWKVPFHDMLMYMFTGSFLANITPGKAGELGKSYFLKKKHGIKLRYGLSSVILEKIADIVVIGLIALFFVMRFVYGAGLESTILVMMLFGALFYASLIIGKKVLPYIFRITLVSRICRKRKLSLEEAELIMDMMRKPMFLLMMAAITFVFWCVGALRLKIISEAVGLELGFFYFMFILSFSLFVGGLSFIPSGLGINDAVMVFLFQTTGTSLVLYGAATLANTLFSIILVNIIGIICFFVIINRSRKIISSKSRD